MVRQPYWVGLDVGHLEMALCMTDAAGRIIFEADRRTGFEALHDVLRVHGVENVQCIAIEAGVGTHIARKLQDRGLPVQILDVRKSSKFLAVRRNKTDKNDARGLAELARIDGVEGARIYLKPLEHQGIRTQLRVRQGLVRNRAKIDALLQSVFRLHGLDLTFPTRREGLRDEVIRHRSFIEMPSLGHKTAIEALINVSEQLRAETRLLDRKLRATVEANSVCHNFTTIPGVGVITALSFYSAICDPNRFARNRDVSAYLGLVPTLSQSGNYARRGRVGRFGNKMTRTHLITAANVLLSAVRQESQLREWGVALRARSGMKTARVAVARKLAVLMLAMWKSGETFCPNGR